MAHLSSGGLGAHTPPMHGAQRCHGVGTCAICTCLHGRSSSAPDSNPVDRTPNLHNIHACEEGGQNQNTREVTRRVRTKQCEDKGKLVLEESNQNSLIG